MFFEIPVEIAWVFVSNLRRHFLERGLVFQQGKRHTKRHLTGVNAEDL
jgi:hypothetical protein